MLIYRHVIDRIKPWLGKEKIILLTGPRQVGKTTILKILEGELKGASKTLFFSCDLEIGNPLFKDPKLFISLLEAELNANPKLYVFLDELQYIPQSGLFLKPVFDRLKSRIQFFVSGSSSLEISRSREFLTGRKIEFRITPFTFPEWLGVSSELSYPRSLAGEPLAELSDFYQAHRTDLEIQALTYLNWGGYPEPAFEPPENKLQIIREIISTYLQKDIAGFLNISNLEGYNNLIRLLAGQAGSLVNRHEISSTLRLNPQTLNRYLAVLEGTYMFTLLPPFFTNVRKEISKMKKAYVFDPGVRRVITNGRPAVSLDEVSGADIENFIFAVLSSAPPVDKLYYYRTISKSEIDFVAQVEGTLLPVEVKFRRDFRHAPTAVRHFLKTYGERTRGAIIVTRDYLGKDAGVFFVPFVLLPFLQI